MHDLVYVTARNSVSGLHNLAARRPAPARTQPREQLVEHHELPAGAHEVVPRDEPERAAPERAPRDPRHPSRQKDCPL